MIDHGWLSLFYLWWGILGFNKCVLVYLYFISCRANCRRKKNTLDSRQRFGFDRIHWFTLQLSTLQVFLSPCIVLIDVRTVSGVCLKFSTGTKVIPCRPVIDFPAAKRKSFFTGKREREKRVRSGWAAWFVQVRTQQWWLGGEDGFEDDPSLQIPMTSD